MSNLSTIQSKEPQIESILRDFELFTGPLTKEIRNRAWIALSNGVSSLQLRSASIKSAWSLSDSIRTEIIDYMATSLQLFFDVVTMIDPTLRYQERFQKIYWEILRSFMKDLENSPILGEISYDTKKEMIQSAIDITLGKK